MAEPQEHSSAQTRPKTDANTGATSEVRSFDSGRAAEPARGRGESPPDAIAQAAQPIVEGSRQVAEQGRRAGRQMADAWRQAVDPLLAMQYDMSQWFDDVFRQTFGFRGSPAAHAFRPMGHLSAASFFGLPPSELKETERAHLLAIELPGLTREDIDLSIEGDTLLVAGHKSEASEDATASYRLSERRYGRFERAFPLPPDVERAGIEARFRDGVLHITLPKSPDAAPARARIDIKG
jgi:HSP20 family protein